MTEKKAGNAITEYSLILALVVLVVMGSLKLFGTNTKALLSNQKGTLSNSQMDDYSKLRFTQVTGTGTEAKNSPGMTLHETSASGSNVTSVEGQTLVSSANIAGQIDQLANQIADPTMKDYAKSIASLLYGSTLSQAFLQENIPSLSKDLILNVEPGYTKTNALRDIYNATNESQKFLNQITASPHANDPDVKKLVQMTTLAINKADSTYPLQEIRDRYLNEGKNASIESLNSVYFQGQATSGTTHSTLHNFEDGNPLPDIAKNMVRQALANNEIPTETAVKSTANAAVTSDAVKLR